jgi:hypothetical protein
MAGRRSPVTDVRELVRRLRMGEPDRRIARDLGVSRNTVARYRAWTQQHELLTGELPPLEAVARLLQPVEAWARPAHEQSQVEPFREQVDALRRRGVEGQAIWQILVDPRWTPQNRPYVDGAKPAIGRAPKPREL